MPVISVVKDAQARTMTITARFDAPIGRVWQLWSDPRQLERWWRPPSYPATVLEHDPAPGGTISYVMTGPNSERHGGWFGVRAADPPHMLELDAGFAVALSELAGDATQMTITKTWASNEAMEQVLATGMQAGMTAAVGQFDALLNLPGES